MDQKVIEWRNRNGVFSFSLLRQEPYVRKDGQASAIKVWQAHCRRCGEPFEITTSALASSPEHSAKFKLRRCPQHRVRH